MDYLKDVALLREKAAKSAVAKGVAESDGRDLAKGLALWLKGEFLSRLEKIREMGMLPHMRDLECECDISKVCVGFQYRGNFKTIEVDFDLNDALLDEGKAMWTEITRKLCILDALNAKWEPDPASVALLERDGFVEDLPEAPAKLKKKL